MNIADSPLPSYSDANAQDNAHLISEDSDKPKGSGINAIIAKLRAKSLSISQIRTDPSGSLKRRYVELEDNPLPKQKGGQPLFSPGSSIRADLKEPSGEISHPRALGLTIIAVKDPLIAEQLADIRQLLNIKLPNLKPSAIDGFMNELLKLTTEQIACTPEAEKSQQRAEFLGKVLFILNARPDQLLDAFSLKNYPDINARLTELFFQHFYQVIQNLQARYKEHLLGGIQPPDVAIKTRIPVEFAKLLLTENGAFNFGIVELLQNVLIGQRKPYLNYDEDICRVLRTFAESSEMRMSLRMVSAPESPEDSANHVIRVLLELGPNEEVSHLHAKQAVLASMMSHLRQGPSGSCFATSLAIKLLQDKPGKSLDDLINLVRKSKLTRMVNGAPMDFPFLLSIADKNLENPFTLTRTGNIAGFQGKSSKLWEVPGIRAACFSAGMQDIQSLVEECVAKIFSSKPKSDFCVTTPQEVLQTMANINAQKTGQNPYELFNKACFGFSSQTNNALLKVWRNSIAGMAEASDNGKLKSAIIKSIQNALSLVHRQEEPETGPFPNDIWEIIQHELMQNIHLQYDPKCNPESLSLDEHSIEGAFILYDKNHSLHPDEWVRVDTPKAFKEFLGRILRKALQKKELIPQERRHILERLNALFQSDFFLIHVLWQYHPHNLDMENLGKLAEHQHYTPWHTNCGHDAFKVVQIYSETKSSPKAIKETPPNAEALLERVIRLGKGLLNDKKSLPAKNPSYVPARLPGIHSFSLLMKDPKLVAAYTDPQDTQQWIHQHLIESGNKIANSLITQQTKSALLSFAAALLAKHPHREHYQKAVSGIPENLTISQFRNHLLQSLRSKLKLTAEETSQLALRLDSYLIHILPPNLKQQFIDSSIHIADTNWQEGIHDLHFCMAFNPGSGQLELMEAYEDNSYWRVLKQKEWVDGQLWEILVE